MPSILDVLCSQNALIHSDPSIHGPNTYSESVVQVKDWVPWDDFNFANLTSMYDGILKQPWKRPLPVASWLSEHDLFVADEHSFDTILRRFISPVVNEALDMANQYLANSSHSESIYLGEGGRCINTTGLPDWGLVKGNALDEQGRRPPSCLPGDTKLRGKWRPKMLSTNRNEWKKPITQLMNYMANKEVRYGFIITEENLVVLRIRQDMDSGASAMCRAKRSVAHASYNYIDLDNSAMSDADLSIFTTSFGNLSFEDDDLSSWEYHPLEHAVIPWSRHGPRTLTIKLALFCLCLMASGNETGIDSSYPPLDSWRETEHGYLHSTTGIRVKKLPRGANLLQEQTQLPQTNRENFELGQSQDEKGGRAGGSNDGYCEQDENDWPKDYPQGGGREGQEHPSNDGRDGQGRDDGDTPGPPGSDEEGGENGSGYDTATPAAYTGPSTRSRERAEKKKKTMMNVDVVKVDGRYVFQDRSHKKKTTSKADWKKGDSGWEYEGTRTVYVTKRLPR